MEKSEDFYYYYDSGNLFLFFVTALIKYLNNMLNTFISIGENAMKSPRALVSQGFTSGKKFLFILLIIQCSICLPFSGLLIAQTPTQEWVNRWPSISPVSSNGGAIKLDSLGYIYVLADTGLGFGFLKYSSAGNLLFSAHYWPGGNYNWGGGAYFDVTPNGIVYITGSVGINFSEWIYTVKFNTNGVFQWGRLYNLDYNDAVSGIKVDRNGDVIVIGGSYNGSIAHAITIKYNITGDTLWTRYFNNGQPSAGNRVIVIDNLNNLYMAGNIGPLPGKCLVSKYSSAGNLIWFNTFTLDPLRTNLGIGIDLDNNGNVYVIGTQVRPQGQTDTYLLKLSNNGDTLWSRNYPRYGTGNNSLWGPVVSSNNNEIYYSGSFRDSVYINSYNIVTLKYNSQGNLQWAKVYSGSVSIDGLNLPTGIKLDKYDNIYVCGTGYYQTTGNDFITLKYLPDGTQQWIARYTGLVTNGGDYGKDLFIDTSLNVYVTGRSRKTINSYNDAVTIKYNQPMGIVNNNENPDEFNLYQNFPNPFNNTAVINYSLLKENNVELQLFNSIGQLVKTLVNQKHQAGTYSIILNMENYSSGIYFYKMQSENYSETKKLILVK